MGKFILSLIWMVVAAIPTLNAQQASPNQSTATQQNSKPKAAPTRTFPQPRSQPTQVPTGNSNPTLDKRIANNPGHGKPAGNIPGKTKPAVNNAGNGKTSDNNNYGDAKRRYRHERHDYDWWKQHYVVIVLVGGGYYYQDSGYWYPAWGYDLNHERYDYDGPIYTYGNLLPDQVIIHVQRALKELGYYAGDLNGSLGVDTRQALSAYQQDFGLDTTGAVDEATVRALGLI
jgi:hypothetical protein